MADGANAAWQGLIDDAIRRATEHVSYEIERDAEQKVAAILRERGWTVLPPAEQIGENDD